MKKTHLFILTTMLQGSGFVTAQTGYEWKEYGLSFSTPSEMTVTESTDDSFEASSDNMMVSVELFFQGISTAEEHAKALADIMKGLNMQDTEMEDLQLTSLKGVYVNGLVDGVEAILVFLLDTESDVGLLSLIYYSDDFEEEAIEVRNSFKMKDREEKYLEEYENALNSLFGTDLP